MLNKQKNSTSPSGEALFFLSSSGQTGLHRIGPPAGLNLIFTKL
ncbi:hypothetical protein [Paenibacillus yonginensis]|nr:hypothetical protein [Paenibacillus yonginensis]